MRRRKHVILIGVVNYYAREFFEGVQRYSRDHGPWDFWMGADNSAETVKMARSVIRQWKPDGIIAHVRSDRVERLLRSSGLPAVNFGGGLKTTLPSVMPDDRAVGRLVAQHFLESGFRNFGYCARTVDLFSQTRCEGFCGELAEQGLTCDVLTDEFAGRVEVNWARNQRRMRRWLLSLKKPAAVMCLHNLRGQEMTWVCQQLGLSVPDDVAIVGASKEEFYSNMSVPPLSGVDLDRLRIGAEAARLLDRLMRGGKAPAQPILIPPLRVVTRQSSEIVVIEDAEIAAVMRYIRDHVAEPISVKDLLREVPISRRVMEQRFVKLVGRTPKAHMMRVRMDRAKNLLAETDMPIWSVARGSGFKGQEIFSASFHREVGATPRDYRRKARRERAGQGREEFAKEG